MYSKFKSSHQRFSLRKASAYNFIKKETLAQVFSCDFCKISKMTFFTEHLRATTSGLVKLCLNSDFYLISKTSSTALLEKTVSHKPLPSLSQENRKILPPALLDSSVYVYLFLDFELKLSKSKEFNNKRMKVQVKRAFKSYFLSSKKK